MGQYFRKDNQFDLAINSFTKAINLEPDNFLCYEHRGISLGEKCQYRESILDFTKAIHLNNKSHGSYNNRGLSYYKLEMFDKAIEDYNQAIRLEPDIDIFYSNRGLAYLYKNDNSKAIKDFDKALELDGSNEDANEFRVEAFAKLTEEEREALETTYSSMDDQSTTSDNDIIQNFCESIIFENSTPLQKNPDED
jgi:tetratricopeptide (TPR) repeat protein